MAAIVPISLIRLIDRHDHHVHDADQDHGDEHELDEDGHHIDHPGDVVKGR